MDWARLAGTLLTVAASGYAIAALLVSWRASTPGGTRRAGAGTRPEEAAPSVSVLKPLCGAEPRLYPNLETFCRQTHPRYQLVFGVRHADDPAVAIVQRLRQAFPARDIVLVVDPREHGRNPKVSNLINMLAAARHDVLVLADSDIAVPADWLGRVCDPLSDPAVGIVTCLYHGHPVGGFWSRLGCQFIDDWFVPAVRVAQAGGSQRFGFGATIALRRETLARIGGFAVLADRLADDYWLGELTRRLGLSSVLSEVMVSTDVTESGPAALWQHELRWMRTVRSLDPAGFAFAAITFTWPMLALGLWLAHGMAVTVVGVFAALARTMLCRDLPAALRAPLRDTLLLLEWAVALAGYGVRWRDRTLLAERSAPIRRTS